MKNTITLSVKEHDELVNAYTKAASQRAGFELTSDDDQSILCAAVASALHQLGITLMIDWIGNGELIFDYEEDEEEDYEEEEE